MIKNNNQLLWPNIPVKENNKGLVFFFFSYLDILQVPDFSGMCCSAVPCAGLVFFFFLSFGFPFVVSGSPPDVADWPKDLYVNLTVKIKIKKISSTLQAKDTSMHSLRLQPEALITSLLPMLLRRRQFLKKGGIESHLLLSPWKQTGHVSWYENGTPNKLYTKLH